jgi:hypothetical protein
MWGDEGLTAPHMKCAATATRWIHDATNCPITIRPPAAIEVQLARQSVRARILGDLPGRPAGARSRSEQWRAGPSAFRTRCIVAQGRAARGALAATFAVALAFATPRPTRSVSEVPPCRDDDRADSLHHSLHQGPILLEPTVYVGASCHARTSRHWATRTRARRARVTRAKRLTSSRDDIKVVFERTVRSGPFACPRSVRP